MKIPQKENGKEKTKERISLHITPFYLIYRDCPSSVVTTTNSQNFASL